MAFAAQAVGYAVNKATSRRKYRRLVVACQAWALVESNLCPPPLAVSHADADAKLVLYRAVLAAYIKRRR
jgi:hypothetical protein